MYTRYKTARPHRKGISAIPSIVPDGIYGPKTKATVEKFQAVFGLPVSGVVDYNTWYEISNIYVAVTRIAELLNWIKGAKQCWQEKK